MKVSVSAAACAALLVFAASCHKDSAAPTQPVLTTPSPVTPGPGSPTPTPPKAPTPTPPPSGATTRIVNVGPGFLFMDSQSGSSATTIKAGDTVQWNFVDSIAHSSTSGKCCTADGQWDSGVKSSGSFSHKFSSAGTFPYFCTVHGAMMTGTVTVGP